MRWIEFTNGSRYTLAVDIQKLAEQNGYIVPCEADGTRHPGTDCNAKMRTILKDAGLRRSFGVHEGCVMDVVADETPVNTAFIRWLVDNGIVSDSYLKIGTIQLYTEEAVNALLSIMLKTYVSYEADKADQLWSCRMIVTKRFHNFEKKKNRPKASLFKK